MDVSNEAPPPTPYRDGKPLAEIIPPDRRAQKTALLVVSSMVAGVALWVTGGLVIEMLATEAPARTPPIVPAYVAARVPNAVLHGPGGDVALPPRTRSVVHVWLQGCTDCMPAFEAMRELEAHGGLGAGVPVVNVAYGEAEPLWAERYGVRTNLVFDPAGTGVVRPLGIGTFATLVVDPDGTIIHRDRPDRAGYRQRVRAAFGLSDDEPEATPVPSEADPGPASRPLPGRGLDAAAVSEVIASHRAALKRQCWDSVPAPKPAHVAITVVLTVDPKGHVSTIAAKGDEPAIRACIERQMKSWTFPAPATDTTISVPFRFETQ